MYVVFRLFSRLIVLINLSKKLSLIDLNTVSFDRVDEKVTKQLVRPDSIRL
jgi:hypothetical protein